MYLALFSIKFTLFLYKSSYKDENITPKKIKILNGFVIITIIMSLSVIGYGQREYILETETPPVERCYYYDAFGNFLHGSRLLYNCPTPEIITQTDETLSMTLLYNYYGSGEGYNGLGMNGDMLFTRRKVDEGLVKVQIDITYTTEHIISSYRLRETTNYMAKDYVEREDEYILDKETIVSHFYEVLIETNFDTGRVYQNKKIYRSTDHENIVDNIFNLSFYDFTDTEPSYEIEYDVLYNIIPNEGKNVIEFAIYQHIPARDLIGEAPLFEGNVVNNLSTNTIYLENEQSMNGEHTFSTIFYEFSINQTDSFASFTKKFYGNIYDKDYTFLEDEILPVAISQTEVGLSNRIGEESKTYRTKSYSEFYHFEDDFKDYLVYSTSYGFRVETYFLDGIKDESELSSTFGEIAYTNFGVDDYIIGLDNQTNLFYEDTPIFDVNPLIKYLLQLVQ